MYPLTMDHVEILLSAILGVIALLHAYMHFVRHVR